LLVVALLAAVAAGASAAEPLRVGLELGSPSAVIVVRPAPFDIKIGYDFTGIGSDPGSNFFHVSGDYRIIDQRPLIEFVSFYFGAGAYMQIMTGNADDTFVLGGRLPLGLQAFFLDGKIEVFLEVVPTLKLLPSIVAFEDWHGFVGVTVPVSLFDFRK
jgi:hypothetical protein